MPKGSFKSMDAKEITQALNDLTIELVESFLGLQCPAKRMTRCPPSDHDDKTPSFEVRHYGRLWINYACNQFGGEIDLVVACQRIEFLEAKQWLADKSRLLQNRGHASPTRRLSNGRSQVSNHECGFVAKEATPDFEVYKALPTSTQIWTSGLEYLNGRKISEELIEQYSTDQVPATGVDKELAEEYRFERVRNSGLLTKNSTR